MAEINRGLPGAPSYLWCKEDAHGVDPIVEIRILKGESEDLIPSSFEKLPKNLLKGSGKSAFLCYRRSKDEGLVVIAPQFVFSNIFNIFVLPK